MVPAPRVNWRIAWIIAGVLVVSFAIQNWFAVTALTFPLAILQQMTVWGMWLALAPSVFRSARAHPLEDRPSPDWIRHQVILAVWYSMLHGCLNGFVRWALGIAAFDSLVDVLFANFTRSIGRNLLTYTVLVSGYQAVLYHRIVRDRDQRAARLELDLAAAKLEGIEGRLRPHFLFNTLNAIAALVRESPEAAERMIGQLAALLRASLRADPLQRVPLGEELALAEQYLAIEQIRFADRLGVSIDASEEAKLGLVPQLILQPLVENAVRHGIAPRERGGSIFVRAVKFDERLRIVIEDDGVGIGNAPSHLAGGGIGLGSVRSRLAYLYGAEQRVEVGAAPEGGTRITIDLPYEASGILVETGAT